MTLIYNDANVDMRADASPGAGRLAHGIAARITAETLNVFAGQRREGGPQRQSEPRDEQSRDLNPGRKKLEQERDELDWATGRAPQSDYLARWEISQRFLRR